MQILPTQKKHSCRANSYPKTNLQRHLQLNHKEDAKPITKKNLFFRLLDADIR